MLPSLSIAADVERACNSPEALSRLLRALLEFEPESPWMQTYVAQLVWYVFYKRRREIAFRSGKIIASPDGRRSSGYSVPRMDMEVARDAAREIEGHLIQDIGVEAVRDLKRRVGRKLSLGACIHRLREQNFEGL